MIPEAWEELFGGTGSNQAITLGGVDRSGKDAVNDLTYVMLRATELLRLRDPNVNARYYYGVNPRKYLERLCEVNITTMATPCFHNDMAVIERAVRAGRHRGGCLGLRRRGLRGAHQRRPDVSATPAPSFNLTAALEMALFPGKHRLTEDEQIGALTTYAAADEQLRRFPERPWKPKLSWLIDQAVAFNNCTGRHPSADPPHPHAFRPDGRLPGERPGCDLGGAKYNSSGATIIGLAEVVDSVTAIQEFVFHQKLMPMADMVAAIKADWEKPIPNFMPG